MGIRVQELEDWDGLGFRLWLRRVGLRHGCSSDSALSNGTEEKLNGGSEGRRKRKGKDSYTSRLGMQKWVVVVG